MKNIVCAIYHDCNKEARSMEMLNCLRLLGHVHYVSYAAPNNISDVECHLIDKTKSTALFSFLNMAKKTIKDVHPEIIFLHDNDCSVLIPYVKKYAPSAVVIYDSSELYIKERYGNQSLFGGNGLIIRIKQILTSFRGKYEKKYLKYADLVIAANIERARKMQEYFKLSETPIVFDNIHRIDDPFDQHECDKKYAGIVQKDKFNILFGGGINEERRTFDFIRDFFNLDNSYNLIIAGSASETARRRYDTMISDFDQSRIHYVGFVTRAELRYLFRYCQASVVVFDTNSFNTLYCASGKCYESLFEGTPIIASENPPLLRLCSENKVGVSNDHFDEAIISLAENYDYFLTHVDEYINELEFDKRVIRLKEQIESALS